MGNIFESALNKLKLRKILRKRQRGEEISGQDRKDFYLRKVLLMGEQLDAIENRWSRLYERYSLKMDEARIAYNSYSGFGRF
tara:strand:+ start:334 stop:579 length:246 start_codon:yes stop_codon:yes gene_type:complete